MRGRRGGRERGDILTGVSSTRRSHSITVYRVLNAFVKRMRVFTA